MSPVISVQNLGKRYILNHQVQERHTSLRDALSDSARRFADKLQHPFARRENDLEHEEFWALKDVSFDIQQGDRVGIIGGNGAGKSTLLKILSRITEPTVGHIKIRGRVSSLLEVGTGFHPELTGRENIYLNGAILGMSKADIKKKFDEIVAFAEVEKFLDTPVKRYSSGMYVRLAFAVAANLEPEVLIIDEVLAVGDAAFQKKCLGKMQDVSAEGRTLLFVSHNMTALRNLCNKAIWLQEGRVLANGDVEGIASSYLQKNVALKLRQSWVDVATAPGNQHIRLHSIKVSYQSEEEMDSITMTIPVDLEFEFWNLEDNASINVTAALFNDQEVCAFASTSQRKLYPKGVVKAVCHIPGDLLNEGQYHVRLVVRSNNYPGFKLEDAATFEVHDTSIRTWFGKRMGVVHPKILWDT